MKIAILYVFVFLYSNLICQITNYNIVNTSFNYLIYPYKVYDSKDGNILLSNGEANWDVGYSNVLKVKLNGDTVFLKGTDSRDLFVTSTGNIITNYKSFESLFRAYNESFLTFYDKDFNRKWQLDFSSSYNANTYSAFSAPILKSVYEINPNRYIASMCTYTGSVFSNYSNRPFYSDYVEFDTLGNILSDRKLDYFFSSKIFGKINSKIYSIYSNEVIGQYNSSFISQYSLTNNSISYFSTDITNLNDCVVFNGKIYCAGQKELYSGGNLIGTKAMISCTDSNGVVHWNKILKTQDSTKNNFITDVEVIKNSLICKYREDTTEYLLRIDTLGNLQSFVQYDFGNYKMCTNLLTYGGEVLSSKQEPFLYGISFVRFDSLGYNSCLQSNSNPNIVVLYNKPFVSNPNVGIVSTGSLPSVNSSQDFLIYHHSVTLSDCNIFTNLNQNIHSNSIIVHPNPTESILRIKLINTSLFDKFYYKIKLVDLLGKVVISDSFSEQIDVSDLEKGLYILNIYENNILFSSTKIMKQ